MNRRQKRERNEELRILAITKAGVEQYRRQIYRRRYWFVTDSVRIRNGDEEFFVPFEL